MLLTLSTLEKLGAKDNIYIVIKEALEPLRNDIAIFIRIGDNEERPQNIVVEFPTIDDEYGLVKDGKVSLNGNTFDMIQSIKKSNESINKLTLILLGIDYKA